VPRAWYEDDAFWHYFGRAAFGKERFEAAKGEVCRLLAFFPNIRPPARIVDFGCGPGRHTLELARRGFEVTGVDRTVEFLAAVEASAQQEGLVVATVLGEFSSCDLPARRFELALCVGLTFGYLSDVGNAQVLENIRRTLAPQAPLVLDAPTPRWPERDGPWFVVARPDLNALVERVPNAAPWVQEVWTVREAEMTRQFGFEQRLYEPAEVAEMLADAGFVDVELFSDVLGHRVDKVGRKTVAVARAPGLTPTQRRRLR